MTVEPAPDKALEELPKIPGDRYALLGVLGRGGMGIVVKASHVHLNKPVAIKILNTVVMDDTSVKRFEVEAKAGSQLSHPNLIAVFDYGLTEDGKPYMVMEYIEGQSLQDTLISQGPPPKDTFITIFEQVCKALQYIHKHNIVHRDIKSSNIMIVKIEDDLYAKLLDFGIAKVLADSGTTQQHLTATGAVFGSPLYMSPEQCMGKGTDPRSDIYSLGCVMYECFAGHPPMMGENALQTIFMHINQAAPSLPETNSQDPAIRAIAQIVHKCLEKDPNNRFQTVAELLKELSSAKNAAATADTVPPATHPARPFVHSESGINRWKKNAAEASGQAPLAVPHVSPAVPPSSITADNVGSNPQSTSDPDILRFKADLAQNLVANLQTGSPESSTNNRSHSMFEPGSLSHIGNTGEHSQPSNSEELHTETISRRATSANLRKELNDEPERIPRAPIPLWLKIAAGVLVVGLIGGGTPFAIDYMQKMNGSQSMAKAEECIKLEHWQDAETNFAAALSYAQSQKDDDTMGKINARLGEIDLHQNELSHARGHFSTALMLLDKGTKPSQKACLEALIGLAEAQLRSGNAKEATKHLNQAREFAKMWSPDALIVGNIALGAAKTLVAESAQTDKILKYYDEAIAKYSELDPPPAEKLATAWIESAELCAKNDAPAEAQRRATRGLQMSARIITEVTKDEFRRRAEPITKLATNSPKAVPANNDARPLVPTNTPYTAPQTLIAPLLGEAQKQSERNSEYYRHEGNKTEEEIKMVQRAEAFTKRMGQLQDQNFKNTTDILERQNRAFRADSPYGQQP